MGRICKYIFIAALLLLLGYISLAIIISKNSALVMTKWAQLNVTLRAKKICDNCPRFIKVPGDKGKVLISSFPITHAMWDLCQKEGYCSEFIQQSCLIKKDSKAVDCETSSYREKYLQDIANAADRLTDFYLGDEFANGLYDPEKLRWLERSYRSSQNRLENEYPNAPLSMPFPRTAQHSFRLSEEYAAWVSKKSGYKCRLPYDKELAWLRKLEIKQALPCLFFDCGESYNLDYGMDYSPRTVGIYYIWAKKPVFEIFSPGSEKAIRKGTSEKLIAIRPRFSPDEDLSFFEASEAEKQLEKEKQKEFSEFERREFDRKEQALLNANFRIACEK